jgi:hypothetical protein
MEEKEEGEVLYPKDFGLTENGDYFCCPTCESKLVTWDGDFIKNNMATKLENNKEKVMHYVLKCLNCQHKDLLVSFLAKEKNLWEDKIFPPSKPWKPAPYKYPKPYYGDPPRKYKWDDKIRCQTPLQHYQTHAISRTRKVI